MGKKNKKKILKQKNFVLKKENRQFFTVSDFACK